MYQTKRMLNKNKEKKKNKKKASDTSSEISFSELTEEESSSKSQYINLLFSLNFIEGTLKAEKRSKKDIAASASPEKSLPLLKSSTNINLSLVDNSKIGKVTFGRIASESDSLQGNLKSSRLKNVVSHLVYLYIRIQRLRESFTMGFNVDNMINHNKSGNFIKF